MAARHIDRRGQTSLYDAILFFVIITIASAILIVAVQRSSGVEEIKEDKAFVGYAGGAFTAISQSTMYHASYRESGGDEVHLYNRSVPFLLLFDVLARERGSADTTSLETGIERPVNELIDNLVDDRYLYVFQVNYNGTVMIHMKDSRVPSWFEPEDFMAEEGKFGLEPYLTNEATFRLMVWRA